MQYIAIDTETPLMHRRMVSMSHLVLGDYLMGIEDEEEKHIFSISEGNSIPYYKDRRHAQRVSFEIDLN